VLIPSHRHTPADLAAWERTADTAAFHAQTKRFRRSVVPKAIQALFGFVNDRCYAGCSWGKDSVVLAHMIATQAPRVPLVWVRVEPIKNPDCLLVRDEFLRLHPHARYEEIEVWCHRDANGWHASGTLERGFSEAAKRFGMQHISGIRGDESGPRKRRMMHFGQSTANTCAPIGWWRGIDVFAYLVDRRLPIHPAYACTMGGLLEPDRLRVASLGGRRGDGMGRGEWEKRYYREELSAIERLP
jgi:phosphoadenosine phosphosulfate reductase